MSLGNLNNSNISQLSVDNNANAMIDPPFAAPANLLEENNLLAATPEDQGILSDSHASKNDVKKDNSSESNTENTRDIGSQAVWSLSSCKPGFGVEQLRDNSLDTYWQSDGPQPHLINIQFRRKTTIFEIKLFADFKLDESYTPSRISVRAGNHFHDIHEVQLLELNEPSGWISIPMRDSNGKPVRAFLVQVAILTNHQNGRDTHVRQIKINSPISDAYDSTLGVPLKFSTTDISQFAVLR